MIFEGHLFKEYLLIVTSIIIQEDKVDVMSIRFHCLFSFLHDITNYFPGGRFIHVRILFVIDTIGPFEHEFFERIAHSYPLLNSFTVFNQREQKRSRQCLNHEQVCSVIEYPHLNKLDLHYAHIDYVEHFQSIQEKICLI
jgi:hypothetical protein